MPMADRTWYRARSRGCCVGSGLCASNGWIAIDLYDKQAPVGGLSGVPGDANDFNRSGQAEVLSRGCVVVCCWCCRWFIERVCQEGEAWGQGGVVVQMSAFGVPVRCAVHAIQRVCRQSGTPRKVSGVDGVGGEYARCSGRKLVWGQAGRPIEALVCRGSACIMESGAQCSGAGLLPFDALASLK
jgi:hypothetical protein